MTMVRVTIMVPDNLLTIIDRAVDIEYNKGRRRSEFFVRATFDRAKSVISASEEASKNDGCQQDKDKVC